MSAAAHLTVGWIYFAAAWLSLFVINGILAFMLTPGQWLTTGDFWDGFFNPTFWPMLVLRTGVCVMLAGLYAMLVAAPYDAGDFKARTVRTLTAWGLGGLGVAMAALYWYWQAIPAEITTAALRMMPSPMNAFRVAIWLAIAL